MEIKQNIISLTTNSDNIKFFDFKLHSFKEIRLSGNESRIYPITFCYHTKTISFLATILDNLSKTISGKTIINRSLTIKINNLTMTI